MSMNPRLLRPTASGFNPRQISGLFQWFDASDRATMFDATTGGAAVADDGTVARWEDKSGNGYHLTQGVSGNRPTLRGAIRNGRSVLEYDGANSNLVSASIANELNALSVFAVFLADTTGQGTLAAFWSNGLTQTGAFRRYRAHPGPSMDAVFGDNGARNIDAENLNWLGAFTRYHVFWNGGNDRATSYEFMLNGSAVASGSSGTYTVDPATPSTFAIGNRPSGGLAWDGYIAEALIYDRLLSVSERTAVDGYLAWKWGMQAQLPSNHPYAYSFPGFGSQPRPSNADALDWESAVYANSGSVSVGTLAAVNTFCNAIDAAGIRDRFYRLNLFCGTSDASLIAPRVPLYRGPSRTGTQYGNTIDTNVSFVQGDYAETGASGGLTSNASKRLDTGLAPDDFVTSGSSHLAYYGAQWTPSTTLNPGSTLIGAYDTDGDPRVYIFGRGNSGACGGSVAILAGQAGNVSGGAFCMADNNIPAGFYVASRISTTSGSLYQNGSSLATSTSTNTYNGVATSILVFSVSFGAGVLTGSAVRMMAYSAGTGMTAQQVTDFNTAMQAFQTSLGRNA